MSKEFTKSYAINRIAELNEQIVEMTDNQNQTMRYLNRIRDENNQLKQQLAEKDKEIERLKKNHLISYTNQKKAYENLKNSMNTKSLIKYPKRLDGCLIKNEQQLLDYAKESTLDIKYLRNNQTQLAIQELEKVKELLLDEYKKYPIVYDKTNDIVAGALDRDKVNEIIDQQINALKGEKDVKD